MFRLVRTMASLALMLGFPMVATSALGFSLFPAHFGAVDEDVAQTLAKWRNGRGLEDGIQVGVDATIATDLGAATPAEIALVEQAILAGFGPWENAALRFDITFGTSVTKDPMTGLEIELLAAPQSDPIFAGTSGAFGLMDPYFVTELLSVPFLGAFRTFLGADIYLNIDIITAVRPLLTQQEQLDALTRLVMHEVGHAIGLGHPDPSANFDTDFNPFNFMLIDPTRAGHNLIKSANIDPEAIMTPRPCGAPVIICAATFFTSLQNDDIGGRDVLYPVVVPEPGLLSLLAAGALMAGAKRCG